MPPSPEAFLFFADICTESLTVSWRHPTLTVFGVLHDHVDRFVILKVVDQPHDVRVLELALDLDFPFDIIDAGEGEQV